MNIYSKLQTARVTLQSKSLKKTGDNKYAGFKYYELGDFLPEINSIFKDLSLFSKFSLEENKAVLTIINCEISGEEVKFETILPEKYTPKGTNPVQVLGGIHTYLKRYLYLNALEIVESDMIDATIGNQRTAKPEVVVSNVEDTLYYESAPEFNNLEPDYDPTPISSETVRIEKPSKTNTYVNKTDTPMSKDKVSDLLLKFLNKPEKDKKKAFGWSKGIQNNELLSVDEKLSYLESIDAVYETNYKQKYEESFLD